MRTLPEEFFKNHELLPPEEKALIEAEFSELAIKLGTNLLKFARDGDTIILPIAIMLGLTQNNPGMSIIPFSAPLRERTLVDFLRQVVRHSNVLAFAIAYIGETQSTSFIRTVFYIWRTRWGTGEAFGIRYEWTDAGFNSYPAAPAAGAVTLFETVFS
jgi:hypothetical protein